MEDCRFQPACDICNETGENQCDYWMHPREFYGRSLLIRNYCDNCVKTFDLYDGRKEKVCFKCFKYVGVFITNPRFLTAFKNLTMISAHFPSRGWIDELEPDEDQNVREAWNFCQLLRKFESLPIAEIIEIIKKLDFDKIDQWINEINEF